MADLDREFFARDTVTVARELIGTTLVAGRCAGRIVETEAYTTDAASHARPQHLAESSQTMPVMRPSCSAPSALPRRACARRWSPHSMASRALWC